MGALLQIVAFGLGALVGSAITGVIHRLPRGIPLEQSLNPRCPSCGALISWYQNIPLLSGMLLRGKCASCKVPIDVRYFVVELLMAFLFVAVFQVFGGSLESVAIWVPRVCSWWLFFSFLVAGTFINIEHLIFPHKITMGGALVGVLCACWAPELVGQNTLFGGLAFSMIAVLTAFFLLWGLVELSDFFWGRIQQRFSEPVSWTLIKDTDSEAPVFILHLDDEDVVHPWEEIFTRTRNRLVLACPDLTLENLSGETVVRKYVTAEIRHNGLTLKKDPEDGGDGERVEWESIKALRGTASSASIPREVMGIGLVFFGMMIGAFTGWEGLLFILISGTVIGAALHTLPRLFGTAEWLAKIPVGPPLAAAGTLWVFYGPEWLGRWLH